MSIVDDNDCSICGKRLHKKTQMRASNQINKVSNTVCIIIVCLSVRALAESKIGNSALVEPNSIDGFFDRTMEIVGKAVDFENWPQSEKLRVAPTISRELLLHPESVNAEFISCSTPLTESDTTASGWTWYRRTLPTKESLSDSLDRLFRRVLHRPQPPKRYQYLGSIGVRLVVGTSSRSVQKNMLSRMSASNMGASAIAASWIRRKGPEGLGDVSFVRNNEEVMFVHDNIFVEVQAGGCFAGEAIQLAYKIDQLIQKQPAYTYEQLVARRPTIVLGQNVEKTISRDIWTISYNVSAPVGVEIMDVKAYVDDRSACIEDGKIHLTRVRKGWTIKLKVTATTDELLSSAIEKEITILSAAEKNSQQSSIHQISP
jgi:hypothetical protein